MTRMTGRRASLFWIASAGFHVAIVALVGFEFLAPEPNQTPPDPVMVALVSDIQNSMDEEIPAITVYPDHRPPAAKDGKIDWQRVAPASSKPTLISRTSVAQVSDRARGLHIAVPERIKLPGPTVPIQLERSLSASSLLIRPSVSTRTRTKVQLANRVTFSPDGRHREVTAPLEPLVLPVRDEADPPRQEPPSPLGSEKRRNTGRERVLEAAPSVVSEDQETAAVLPHGRIDKTESASPLRREALLTADGVLRNNWKNVKYRRVIPPRYPPLARGMGYEGEVLVRVRIDERGLVSEATLHRSSHYPILDRAALRAVRKWRFEPAYWNGREIAQEVIIPVRFQLR